MEPTMIRCPDCDGEGLTESECWACHGSGEYDLDECEICSGTGMKWDDCFTCYGDGEIEASE